MTKYIYEDESIIEILKSVIEFSDTNNKITISFIENLRAAYEDENQHALSLQNELFLLEHLLRALRLSFSGPDDENY